MLYLLSSILFPTVEVNIAHLTVLHVCVSNAINTEFCLSIALGDEMDLVSLTLLISK